MKVQVKRKNGWYNLEIKDISWHDLQRLARTLSAPNWPSLGEEIEKATAIGEQPLPDTTGIANY